MSSPRSILLGTRRRLVALAAMVAAPVMPATAAMMAVTAAVLTIAIPATVAAAGTGTTAEAAAGSGASGETADAADGRATSPMEALGELLGAMSGNSKQKRPPIDREKLRERMPDSVAGERRTRIKSGVNEVPGFSGAYTEADYGSGDRKMTVKLTDMGALGALSASFGQISEEESDMRYERNWREEGRYLQLKSDKQARTVDYSIHFASGVVLEVDARGFTMDEVKAAVAAVDPKKIEGLTPPAPAR